MFIFEEKIQQTAKRMKKKTTQHARCLINADEIAKTYDWVSLTCHPKMIYTEQIMCCDRFIIMYFLHTDGIHERLIPSI